MEITNEDLMKAMTKLTNTVAKDREDTKNELNRLTEKVDKVIEEALKNKVIDRMNSRLKKIEREMIKTIEQRENREALEKNMEERDRDRRNEVEQRDNAWKKSVGLLPGGRKENENERQAEKENEKEISDISMESSGSYKSDWAAQVEDEYRSNEGITAGNEEKTSDWLDNHVRTRMRKDDKTKKVKNKNVKTTSGMNKLRKWFGDTSDEESEEEEKEVDGNWSEVKRKEKNEEKKRKRIKTRKEKIRKVTDKARHILGIGPILPESLIYHQKRCKNFNDAKLEAVKEFLQHYLKFDTDKIENLSINETQMSAKSDGIIYVAFDDISNIKDIHARIAEVQNKEIMTRNFIPPQYFERYIAISKKCSEMRMDNKNLKTLMRFNKDDIEVLTKIRGTDDFYQILPLGEIMEEADIPSFDFSINWKRKEDKPPRRHVSNSPVRGAIKSANVMIQPVSRQSSTDSSKIPAKRIRNAEN